jgi:phosphinothricin acetyltransferase
MNDYKLKEYQEEYKDQITRIFNYYVKNEFAAYNEDVVDSEFLNRMMSEKDYPKYIVEFQEGQIVGFGFAFKYHQGSVFNKTLKLAYFIEKEHTNKGIGISLLEKLESDCGKLKIENLLVHICSLNEASLNFHRKYGFKECGRFKNIGYKFGKYFDDVWMQKNIKTKNNGL